MNVKEQLDEAFSLLTKIPVSGDYVDVMFAVKQKLRAVYQSLKEEEHGG